jgi:hypothetical protein
MNSFVAASFLESPLLILVLIALSSLYSWLMKKRQSSREEKRPQGDEQPASPGAEGHAERGLNLQEVLRRLLGGDSFSPSPLPPPLPFGADDPEPSYAGRNKQQFDPQQTWTAENREAYDKARQTAHEAEQKQQAAALRYSEQREKAARRFAQLNAQAKLPATVVRARVHRSSTQPASLWRDSRAVRRAFVASLIFAPPKGLEP